MTVKVSPHPNETDELDRAIKAIREYYKEAKAANARSAGFIKKPLAWALYKAWRDADSRGDRYI